ncbi:MAG: hypothetical protein M3121_00795, partial [Chloroflexota bacterium]|nr:hypothetical protein [Chloroflexota bacterium]
MIVGGPAALSSEPQPAAMAVAATIATSAASAVSFLPRTSGPLPARNRPVPGPVRPLTTPAIGDAGDRRRGQRRQWPDADATRARAGGLDRGGEVTGHARKDFGAGVDASSFRLPSEALATGDSRRLRDRTCVHWLDTGKDRWVSRQRHAGWHITAVELAEGATALPRLQPADRSTIVLLGHETTGIPEE